jgi:hypothetical protein
LLFGELSGDIFQTQTREGYLNEHPVGVPGLFFDQAHGLLFFAPVYILAFLGAWIGVRDPQTRVESSILVIAYVVYHVLMGLWQDWTGGMSATSRYIIPVLPILVILVARAVEHLLARKQWVQPLVLTGVSIWLTVIVLQDRLLMYGFGMTSNSLLREHFQTPELAVVFPSFMSDNLVRAYGVLILNGLVFIVLWYIGSIINRFVLETVQRRSGLLNQYKDIS